jgi:peptide/nickel transport system substrate-binding protein
LIADDFILSYQITKDPTQDVVDRTRVDKIEKMESLGANKKTLVVTWSEPHAYYHNYRNHEALPAHIVGPIYRQQPERLSRSDFGLKPLLAGPFTISKWSPGEYVTAKANRYSKGFVTPKLREITWRIVPNMATLESNLVAGNIDVMSLELHQALNFQKRYGNQFNFYFVPSLAWEHIDFNLDSPILKDKRVRQALAYGADREGITQLLFEGRQPVSHGTVPEKSPYFNPDVRKYNYDTKRANELLDKAGWLRSDSRSLRRKDGKPLRLTLMTTSGNPTRERIQQLLQASWRQLGVDVEIRNQPAKVFVGETLRGRKFPHMALYSGNADPLAFLETAWRCDCVPRASNSFSGANTTGFCNVKADALLKSISRELNPQKRALIAHQFESLFAQELPAMPLYFRVAVSVTKKGLKNWKPTGMTQPVTWNAHEWDWKLPGEIGE